jgi:5-formyltetrahydrofolate cyclo-ligase
VNKLYVLVRQDLPKNYQAVQAGHAVAQWILDFPNAWKNEILIYLKADNEVNLIDAMILLEKNGEKCSPFFEPDLNEEMTALAFLSTTGTDEFAKNHRLI